MNREQAFQFIRLYKWFQETGLKIVDYNSTSVELQLAFSNRRVWLDDLEAAKWIEASCRKETVDG